MTKPTPYAVDTKVPVTQTRNEIEALLAKHGADKFGYVSEADVATLMFLLRGRQYRFRLPMPDAEALSRTASGVLRTQTQVANAQAQAQRARWRAMLLIIKAKLEAAAQGITTVEEEFFSALVLPNGETMAQHYGPQVARAIETRTMPAQLMLDGPR